jgi:cytochrome c2
VRHLPQKVICLAAALGAAAAWSAGAAAQSAGDAERGRQVFETKQCARCHAARESRGVGPPLETLRRAQGAYELAGRLWNHAPAMMTVFTTEGMRWPDVSAAEMADLMAYLGADATRDPKPDALKGQRVLVSKNCLKCHSWRGEGARVAGDLADHRDDYAPAARWAATTWTHAPRIAAKALERGIPYPRFNDDEMAHLVAFLRTGSPAR